MLALAIAKTKSSGSAAGKGLVGMVDDHDVGESSKDRRFTGRAVRKTTG